MGVFSYCEQKTKNAQSAVNSIFTALLLFCCKIFMSLSFLYKGVQICRLVLSACFRVFIDSPGCTEIFGTAFLFLPFYRIIHKG